MDSVPPPLFVALPLHLRKKIYLFAGLIRECPIVLIPSSRAVNRSPCRHHPAARQGRAWDCNFTLRKTGGGFSMPHESRECECPEVPKQLLLINKALHQETQNILYSESKFIVRARQADDLEILESLSSGALRALRHLLVLLNCWPCYRGHTSPFLWKIRNNSKCITCQAPVALSDPELSAEGVNSECIKERWSGLCKRLASCLVPGRLTLEFICDVEDSTAARQITEPLKSLPPLKDCVIRLSRRRNPHLRSIAHATATDLMNEPQEKQLHLSLLSLPQEIRLRILEYTNLGPLGYFQAQWNDITVKHGRFDQARRGQSLNFQRTCCRRCSFTKLDCSCPLNYGSFSPHCQCRDLPLDLFLVNRQIYADAVQTLYAANTFIFDGPFRHTLSMLQSLRPATLKYFRRIKFRLEARQIIRWKDELDTWISLVSFISRSFLTSKLLIIFDASVDCEPCSDADYSESFIRLVYNGYISFIRAIKGQLDAVLDFHLHLGAFFHLEPVLEKYIMGTEYNSRSGNYYSKAAHSFEQYPNADKEILEIPFWHIDIV